MSSLEAAEREARAAEQAVKVAEDRMRRLGVPPGSIEAAAPGSSAPLPTRLPPPEPDFIGSKDDEERDLAVKEEPNDPCEAGFGPYLRKSLHELLLTSSLNWLLLCTPFAYYGVLFGKSDTWIFTFSLLAIAPFAERLSYVTEQLAMHTSETLGGLLNATFGNVTELIVALFALRAGATQPEMLRIVQVSLLGSILSNLLLVLGTAFLVGGLKHPEQKFNRTAQTASFGLLLLSVICMTMPAVLNATHETESITSSLDVSRSVSIMMLATYVFFLFFQLYTHTHIFEGDDDGDDDGEERVLGAWGAIFWLAVITFFISVLSEWMVEAIRGAAAEFGVPDLFLGTIVIPIVGNAAEHAAAIIFAHKNKMELSLGIAVGSATQIALFVVPLCIVIGWAIDVPLDLDMHPFETAMLLMSVVLVGVLIQPGQSHWLLGFVLMCAYVVISMGFFVHVDVASPPPPPS